MRVTTERKSISFENIGDLLETCDLNEIELKGNLRVTFPESYSMFLEEDWVDFDPDFDEDDDYDFSSNADDYCIHCILYSEKDDYFSASGSGKTVQQAVRDCLGDAGLIVG